MGVLAAVVLLSAAGGAAWLYANRGASVQAPETPREQAAATKGPLARFATGSLAQLQAPAAPEPAPNYVFKDAEGRDVRFSDFQGRVTVVNLWAMWCAPCKTEMPTLAALAQAYGGRDLMVLPINVDATPEAVANARRFLQDHAPLPLYSDIRFQLPFEFAGAGRMPQTILLDRQGRIRAWQVGEADWAGPEARALIDALLAEPA